ncbi:MAG: hypothetical protein ABSA02_21810 [Trebonia sp.]
MPLPLGRICKGDEWPGAGRTPPPGEIGQRLLSVHGGAVRLILDGLDRPNVTGWARLHADASATTLRNDDGRTWLTGDPFIDSKEYLAGLFLIWADNLDGALAIAG